MHFTLNTKKMKKRNLFMSLTLICGLFTVAFTFNPDQITWLWTENKPVGLILLILAFIFSLQWIKYQRLLNKAKKT